MRENILLLCEMVAARRGSRERDSPSQRVAQARARCNSDRYERRWVYDTKARAGYQKELWVSRGSAQPLRHVRVDSNSPQPEIVEASVGIRVLHERVEEFLERFVHRRGRHSGLEPSEARFGRVSTPSLSKPKPTQKLTGATRPETRAPVSTATAKRSGLSTVRDRQYPTLPPFSPPTKRRSTFGD